MPDSIITLTTDFGLQSPYVAALKGVILDINPQARLVDLSHEIPAWDLRSAACFLASAIPCFPVNVIHVVVVDPGVGTDRALLHVELRGQQLLVPDNGCWTLLDSDPSWPPRVRRLSNERFWRRPVSSTFHGRDILAPAAGHLSRGVKPAQLGPRTDHWLRLEMPVAGAGKDAVKGAIVHVDHFGNLLSNIPQDMIRRPPTSLAVGQRTARQFSWVTTYGEAKPGQLVALISSSGTLEVAVVQGNAARRLNARVGTAVRVGQEPNAAKPQ